MKKFKHGVKYPRTANWWSGGWHEISNWLNECVGSCTIEWEYVSETFLFTREQDKMMFLLRWK